MFTSRKNIMMQYIFTDISGVGDEFLGFKVCRYTGEKSEQGIYMLENITNIYEAVSMKLPVVIVANASLSSYPILSDTIMVEDIEALDEEFLTMFYNRFYGISNVMISTDRLVIREITLSDLDELYELYDESVTQYVENLYERHEEEEFTKAYINNMYGFYGYGLWLVCEKDSGKIVGRAGLSHREVDGEVRVELGYLIGGQYRGRGYAYEACKAILTFAKKIGKKNIIICTRSDNLPSLNLAYKLGFKKIAMIDDEEKHAILSIIL